MKRTLLSCVLLSLFLAIPLGANEFKKINAQGEANMIFASEAIEKGQEAKAKPKEAFTSKDKIFGRIYVPKALGQLGPNEEYVQELWIDGKVATRTDCSKAVKPGWETMQLWLFNTGDDEAPSMKEALDDLREGKHEVIIFFLHKKFLGMKKKLNDRGVFEQVKEFKAVYLSKGTFTLTVN
jgi:hypothetical protein